MRKIIFTVAIALFAASGLRAQHTTQDLVKDCKAYITVSNHMPSQANDDVINAVEAISFIRGYMTGLDGAAINIRETTYVLHLADGVSPDQVIRVYLKYTDAHPEILNKDIDNTLFLAMIDAKLWQPAKAHVLEEASTN